MKYEEEAKADSDPFDGSQFLGHISISYFAVWRYGSGYGTFFQRKEEALSPTSKKRETIARVRWCYDFILVMLTSKEFAPYLLVWLTSREWITRG